MDASPPRASSPAPGLARVHRARLIAEGLTPTQADTPEIVAAALANREGEEAKSLRLFWRIVGRLAGDMAVAFVALGGVTLAGGVLPRIVEFLDEGEFRRAFEDKAPIALHGQDPDAARHPLGHGVGWHGGDRGSP